MEKGTKMKTFRINAIMENDDEKSPIVFTFDLPGKNEESVYTLVENMKSVKKIISVKKKAPVIMKKTTILEKKIKTPIKISNTYVPKETEKYMCEKHLFFFKIKLTEWKKELVKANNEALYNGSMDDNSVSADIVDQASSYTDKTVEMKAINRQIKLISKIDQALIRVKNETYGFCAETTEPIGLKRLMARPVAELCIAAQEKHEKEEKVYADD
jgi:DnaK suppressor protein